MSKIEELLKQQQKIQEEIEKIRSEEKTTVINEVKQKIRTYKLTLKDLFDDDDLTEFAVKFSLRQLDNNNDEKTRKRRTKEEKEADEKAKHEKSIADAKAAFEDGIQVRKFHNEETGISKYYWNGKKGLMPKGKDSVVKSIDEIN